MSNKYADLAHGELLTGELTFKLNNLEKYECVNDSDEINISSVDDDNNHLIFSGFIDFKNVVVSDDEFTTNNILAYGEGFTYGEFEKILSKSKGYGIFQYVWDDGTVTFIAIEDGEVSPEMSTKELLGNNYIENVILTALWNQENNK